MAKHTDFEEGKNMGEVSPASNNEDYYRFEIELLWEKYTGEKLRRMFDDEFHGIPNETKSIAIWGDTSIEVCMSNEEMNEIIPVLELHSPVFEFPIYNGEAFYVVDTHEDQVVLSQAHWTDYRPVIPNPDESIRWSIPLDDFHVAFLTKEEDKNLHTGCL